MAFFTPSCAVSSILHHLYEGRIELPFLENRLLHFPGLPHLKCSDMPSFMYEFGSYPTALKLMLDEFENNEETDWILVNTFYDLEREVCMYVCLLLRGVSEFMSSLK